MLSYVVSNNAFQLDSYGHVSVIYNVRHHNIPSCVWHRKTYGHMFYQLLFFLAEALKGRLAYVYPYVSLINQVFVTYFTILHRLTHLCFMQVILDLGDSRKRIIPSLNRLMHWKVEFQSLLALHGVNLNFKKNVTEKLENIQA